MRLDGVLHMGLGFSASHLARTKPALQGTVKGTTGFVEACESSGLGFCYLDAHGLMRPDEPVG